MTSTLAPSEQLFSAGRRIAAIINQQDGFLYVSKEGGSIFSRVKVTDPAKTAGLGFVCCGPRIETHEHTTSPPPPLIQPRFRFVACEDATLYAIDVDNQLYFFKWDELVPVEDISPHVAHGRLRNNLFYGITFEGKVLHISQGAPIQFESSEEYDLDDNELTQEQMVAMGPLQNAVFAWPCMYVSQAEPNVCVLANSEAISTLNSAKYMFKKHNKAFNINDFGGMPDPIRLTFDAPITRMLDVIGISESVVVFSKVDKSVSVRSFEHYSDIARTKYWEIRTQFESESSDDILSARDQADMQKMEHNRKQRQLNINEWLHNLKGTVLDFSYDSAHTLCALVQREDGLEIVSLNMLSMVKQSLVVPSNTTAIQATPGRLLLPSDYSRSGVIILQMRDDITGAFTYKIYENSQWSNVTLNDGATTRWF